jgi:hypothetical protein
MTLNHGNMNLLSTKEMARLGVGRDGPVRGSWVSGHATPTGRGDFCLVVLVDTEIHWD